MQADWNVPLAIVRIVKTFTFPPSVHHVIGYQDNKKSYTEFNVEALLNVVADKLAGMFIYSSDESLLYLLMIKGVVVLLQSIHSTICSNYHENI